MQDRYVGDIGDFAKYGLLRAVSGALGGIGERRLAIAWWYRSGNRAAGSTGDGRLTGYLNAPERWRHLDEELFDTLRQLVCQGHRKVTKIEESGILRNATFHREPVPADVKMRDEWFEGVIDWLDDCDPDLIFADPDNGLYPDHGFNGAKAENAKRISPSELKRMADGRTAIVYHHFHRSYSHHQQLREWMNELPGCHYVYRWRARMPRAFFVITDDDKIERRLEWFAVKWKAHGALVRRTDLRSEASGLSGV